MKKYYVNVHYDVVIPMQVVAVSEDDAIKTAIMESENVSLDNAEVTDITGCITDIEEIVV